MKTPESEIEKRLGETLASLEELKKEIYALRGKEPRMTETLGAAYVAASEAEKKIDIAGRLALSIAKK